MAAASGATDQQTAPDGAVVWEQWDDPADAQYTWRLDTTHFPDVITPLGHELAVGPFWEGFGLASGDEHPGEPNPFRSRRVNGYLFITWDRQPVSPPAPPTEEAPKPLPTTEGRLARLAGAGERWRNELLPEIEGLNAYYRTTDFDTLSDDALAREVEQLRPMRLRQGHLHDLALSPWSQAMRLLIDTYKELTGGEGVQAVRLVHGYGSKSVEAGNALWRLSQLAASLPSVRERLLSVDSANARQLLAEIEDVAEARPFVQALRAFLDEYGWRNDLFEIAMPTWAEDPTIPLCQLRAYLQMPDYDPVTEQARLAMEREAFVAETMAALAPEQRETLHRVIEAAKDVVSIQEDHNFYIDQRLMFLPRRLLLAAGRRLVAQGHLDRPEDIFTLHAREVLEALCSPAAERRRLAAVAQARREEMARWATLTPPPFIGAPPPPPPPPAPAAGAAPAPGSAALEDDVSRILTGNSGAAGVARGPARILRSLSEADRLQHGDVLVARTTMPAWTPLFAVASALVVEVGSVLSHSAVTAREYGIPAVLSVKGATATLRDGQLIEVDGTRGRVRLLG